METEGRLPTGLQHHGHKFWRAAEVSSDTLVRYTSLYFFADPILTTPHSKGALWYVHDVWGWAIVLTMSI